MTNGNVIRVSSYLILAVVMHVFMNFIKDHIRV